MKPLIPVLIAGATFATFCTAVGLLACMDTLFAVAGAIAAACLVASIAICEREAAQYRAVLKRAAQDREVSR